MRTNRIVMLLLLACAAGGCGRVYRFDETSDPALSPDGATTAYLASTGHRRVEQVLDHSVTHPVNVKCELVWYPTGREDEARRVRLRGVRNVVFRSPFDDVREIRFSPDGRYIAAIRHESLHVVDTQTNQVWALTPPGSAPVSMVWYGPGELGFAALYQERWDMPEADRLWWRWSVDTPMQAELLQEEKSIYPIFRPGDVSPDGRYVVLAREDRSGGVRCREHSRVVAREV